MGNSPVRILIADEEHNYRENLRQVLKPLRRLEIAGESHDEDTTFALVERLSPRILLLDYSLCRKLAASGGWEQRDWDDSVLIIIMLIAPEKAKIIEAFRLGAQGIVLKGSPARIWWRSIGAVASGQYWLGNETLSALIEAIRESPSHGGKPTPAGQFGLTRREIEIVAKIADGRSNKEVGREFSIQERTVKHHLTNIFGKVGVSSRLELALFARDHRISPTSAQSADLRNSDSAQLRGRRRQADGGSGIPSTENVQE